MIVFGYIHSSKHTMNTYLVSKTKYHFINKEKSIAAYNKYVESLARDKMDSKAETVTMCQACCDEFPPDQMYRAVCCGDSYFCKNCTMTMFDSTLVCPRNACNTLADPLTVFALTDRDVKWLGPRLNKTAKFERRLPYCTGGKMGEFVCKTPNCEGAILYNTASKSSFHACTRCETPHCVHCKDMITFHVDGKCSVNQLNDCIAAAGAKQCPNPQCGEAISLGEGCNCMLCVSCGTYFCWLCGLLMDHMTEPHASIRSHAHFHKETDDEFIEDHYKYSRPCCTSMMSATREEFEARPGNANKLYVYRA